MQVKLKRILNQTMEGWCGFIREQLYPDVFLSVGFISYVFIYVWQHSTALYKLLCRWPNDQSHELQDWKTNVRNRAWHDGFYSTTIVRIASTWVLLKSHRKK